MKSAAEYAEKVVELCLPDHGGGIACERCIRAAIAQARQEATEAERERLIAAIKAKAEAFPLGLAYHGGPLHDASIYNVHMEAIDLIRAAAIRKGETA